MNSPGGWACAVPELVRFDFDPVIGLGEPDQEIQDLLRASGGLNLGMDFLPGALGFDPLAFAVDARRGRPGRVVRRADRQRRPLLAQPQHAGLAPATCG